MTALLRVQPVSGLSPQLMGIIEGFAHGIADWLPYEPSSIWLLEPPAGRREVYVDPAAALGIMLRHLGRFPDAARARANDACLALVTDCDAGAAVRFYDSLNPDAPICVPASVLLRFMRARQIVPPHLLDFMARAVEAIQTDIRFSGHDNRDASWTLASIPALPTPAAMIEFMPGPGWAHEGDETQTARRFEHWRDAMRPTAARLEKALGEPVYHFADPNCDTDDDCLHRFLQLHWLCTVAPDAAYIRFLIEASDANDVEELKDALIDPASYRHPFSMQDAYPGIESRLGRITLPLPGTTRRIGMAISTPTARDGAGILARTLIGADIEVMAPAGLIDDAWRARAALNSRHFGVRTTDRRVPAPEIAFLVGVDELVVIGDGHDRIRDGGLPIAEATEDLLWRAHLVSLPALFFYPDGAQLSNPADAIARGGAPARVARKDAERLAFTQALNELRLDAEYGSSGLWNGRGQMLSYDHVSLPFALIRRLAAWHDDYDNTLIPTLGVPVHDAWWDAHTEEQEALAKALKEAIGPQTRVCIFRDERWQAI